MANILNHNRNIFDLMLNENDYWDFHLYLKQGGDGELNGNLTERCLSAFIDMDDADCVWFDNVYSKEKYKWEDSYNNGVELTNIGYTGVDNGLISYEKDKISNKEFLELFLNSKQTIEEGDMRLVMKKVSGNNQIYDYSNDTVYEDSVQVARLNGGFYQGFFKLCGNDYKVLPTRLNNGWTFEFVLKPSDFEEDDKFRLNNKYPDNEGIFFYIGTRAENKWWKYYKTEDFEKSNNGYSEDGYSDEFVNDDENLNIDYIAPIDDTIYTDEEYVSDDYITNVQEDGYFDNKYVVQEYGTKPCNICGYYVEDEYLEKETEIDANMALLTSEGFEISQPNIIQYKTDNKFILFNRTRDGFTVNNWDDDNEVILHDIKIPELDNYFTLFNRTKNGYTVDTIDKLIQEKNKEYSVLKDLYRNAFGLQIKTDGSVGYKFLVKDCDSEEANYKVESEFTKAGVAPKDEWNTITVTLMPKKPKEFSPKCETFLSVENEMRIMIYVNGKLRLISKYLPILNLKQLDDLDEKQESVPYNISIGGGTQGLCDVIYTNYRELPKYVLPLEKEFAGSFIGYLKSFRFYSCPINFTEIQNNYIYDKNFLV